MKESIKIKLPEDNSDITLEQSQKYINIAGRENLSDLDKTKRVVKMFTGLKTKEVYAMDLSSTIAAVVAAALTNILVTRGVDIMGGTRCAVPTHSVVDAH